MACAELGDAGRGRVVGLARRIARIAASWMFSGVSKSGSPRAKSRTSTPSAFSRFASAAIARVAEGAINLERAASANGMIRPFSASRLFRSRRNSIAEFYPIRTRRQAYDRSHATR